MPAGQPTDTLHMAMISITVLALGTAYFLAFREARRTGDRKRTKELHSVVYIIVFYLITAVSKGTTLSVHHILRTPALAIALDAAIPSIAFGIVGAVVWTQLMVKLPEKNIKSYMDRMREVVTFGWLISAALKGNNPHYFRYELLAGLSLAPLILRVI